MNNVDTGISQRLQKISELDLEPIKVKLMNAFDGPGWSLEKADLVEQEYKRYLELILKYPNTVLMPSHEIDVFWHNHILDTRKYADDCEFVFGYFLHHFPYLGIRSPEDKIQAKCFWSDTNKLFEQEFGFPMGKNIPVETSSKGHIENFGDCAPDTSCGDDTPPGSSCDNTIEVAINGLMRPKPDRAQHIVI